MTVDPVAIITAIGIAIGSLTGSLEGYGVQVGAVIRPGDSVEIGVDPILYYDSPVLFDVGIAGITLGTVTLTTPVSRYAEAAAESFGLPPEASQTFEGYYIRVYRNVLHYEAGHREFWARFGVMYPVELLGAPCDYDPAYPWAICPGPTAAGGLNTHRLAYGRVLPAPEHYAVMFAVWESP